MNFGQAFDPMRSLQAAWKLLKQAPVMVLIGGLLLAFLEGGGSGGGNFMYRQNGSHGFGRSPQDEFRQVFEEIRPWLLLIIPLILCVGLVFFALSSWIEAGFARAVESALRTGRDGIGVVFSGGNRFGAMLLARLLSGLIQFASALPLIGVGIGAAILADRQGIGPIGVLLLVGFALLWLFVMLYIGLGLYLVNPIVALEGCTPSESIARSWKLASGNRFQLFLFLLVQWLVTIAGFCACCVGLFVAVPLTQVMRFEGYIALTKGGEYPQWWIGTGRFPFDEQKSEGFGSPPEPPPIPPPLPPQA